MIYWLPTHPAERVVFIYSQREYLQDEAALAAGADVGPQSKDRKQEPQVGLIRIKDGDWGYLTPGWGPVGAKQVNTTPLFDAYVTANLTPYAWLHGHFDDQLNFSATDFVSVWGRPNPSYLVNKNGEVRILRDSHLQDARGRLPKGTPKTLSGLMQYYRDTGLPGDLVQ